MAKYIYDVFIAYHGTNKESGGTYQDAKELADFLYENGIYSFVIKYATFKSDANMEYHNTDGAVQRSNLFILIANNTITQRLTNGAVYNGGTDYLLNELDAFKTMYSEADDVTVKYAHEYKSRCNLVFLNTEYKSKLTSDNNLQKLHGIFKGHSGTNSELLGTIYGINKGKDKLDLEYKNAILEWVKNALSFISSDRIDDEAKANYVINPRGKSAPIVTTNTSNNIIKPSKKKNNKKLIFILLMIVLILALGITIPIVITNSNKKNNNQNQNNPIVSGIDSDVLGSDSEIKADATNYKVGDKINLGYYPQSKVDTKTSNELNSKSGNIPTKTNSYNWKKYDYHFYEKESTTEDYMYYQDIDLDSDGTYDYRGVFILEYRRAESTKLIDSVSKEAETDQYKNDYKKNTPYWFKYEQIEWNILDIKDNKAFIVSNMLLDSQPFYPADVNNYASLFNHNGGNGYANNYELSDIRKWLNDNFYNISFSDSDKSKIEKTLVDNSANSATLESPYLCNDTNDYMFLLSTYDINKYFSVEEKVASPTDYAKSQGIKVYSNGKSYYWLRTPYNSASISANGIYYNASIEDSLVECTDCGIRIACYIDLTK